MSLVEQANNLVKSLALDRPYYQSIGKLGKQVGARYFLSIYS